MKTLIKIILVFTLVFANILPFQVFAAEQETKQWQDAVLSAEELEEILSKGYVISPQPKATGLITRGSFGIGNQGTMLIIAGDIFCIMDVVKCGFKEIVIQRRAASTAEWSDYITYEDIYNDDCVLTLTKTLTVPSGYLYRATCIYYAKKNIFSTQKIEAVSNTIYI